MSDTIFELLMKRNKPVAEAFEKNPVFRTFLIGLYLAANEQAEELGCQLEDMEIVDAKMSADGRATWFKMQQTEDSKTPKSVIINPATGKGF